MSDSNVGLILYLPLDEIKDGMVLDQTDNDNDGTLNGQPQLVPDETFGSCVSFDGIDDYVDLPPESCPQGNEITVSFWANGASALPSDSSAISALDPNGGRVLNIHLPWYDSQIYFDCGYDSNGVDTIKKPAQASDFKGRWTHWAFTKNAATGEMKIYLDGLLWHSGKGLTKPLMAAYFTLGAFGKSGSYYPGKLRPGSWAACSPYRASRSLSASTTGSARMPNISDVRSSACFIIICP